MRRNMAVILALAGVLVGYALGTPTSTPFHSDGLDPVSLHALPGTDWIAPTLEAQTGDFRGFQKTFTAQTATGTTATSGLMRGIPVAHTIELVVTGGPTGCTYRLQGSRDGTTWFNISAADITCTTSTVAFENGKPAVSVRGNLLTLTGGTTPSVTLKYIGK